MNNTITGYAMLFFAVIGAGAALCFVCYLIGQVECLVFDALKSRKVTKKRKPLTNREWLLRKNTEHRLTIMSMELWCSPDCKNWKGKRCTSEACAKRIDKWLNMQHRK